MDRLSRPHVLTWLEVDDSVLGEPVDVGAVAGRDVALHSAGLAQLALLCRLQAGERDADWSVQCHVKVIWPDFYLRNIYYPERVWSSKHL